MQVWVNRRKNIPEIEAMGRKYGIPVFGDVATGRAALKPDQPSLRVVLEHIDRRAWMPRAISGGAQLGFGVFMSITSGTQAWNDVRMLLADDQNGDASLARLGQHLSMTAAGGLFSASGSIQVARSLGYASKLAGLSRWSGRLGLGATLAAGGFVLWQYQSGQLSDREFTRLWVPLGTSAVLGAGGAWACVWTGAAIGSWFGPAGTVVGGVVGGLVGGVGAGWLGNSLASSGLEAVYSIKDQRMESQRVRFVYSLYGLK
jgi:hypothetical protein